MRVIQYDFPQMGCYCDGANGQERNDLRVIEMAVGYGWEDKHALALLAADELDDEAQELLSYVVQDAEDYLNELETRSYMSWGWQDGDFGLYPDVDGAREDVGFVSSKAQDYPPDDYRGEWLHVSDHGNATLYVRGEDGKDKEIWGIV